MNKEKKLQIRNSTAEFLIFTKQAGANSIEVRVEDETVWLTQKLMAALFDVDVRTIHAALKFHGYTWKYLNRADGFGEWIKETRAVGASADVRPCPVVLKF